mmetsp:Transcript_29028/g.62666  ORF Transcript_29028/g.62666 Transcript_29028/m.62666 type:complete len:312 (-) Transcript_29028:49-984(-)
MTSLMAIFFLCLPVGAYSLLPVPSLLLRVPEMQTKATRGDPCSDASARLSLAGNSAICFNFLSSAAYDDQNEIELYCRAPCSSQLADAVRDAHEHNCTLHNMNSWISLAYLVCPQSNGLSCYSLAAGFTYDCSSVVSLGCCRHPLRQTWLDMSFDLTSFDNLVVSCAVTDSTCTSAADVTTLPMSTAIATNTTTITPTTTAITPTTATVTPTTTTVTPTTTTITPTTTMATTTELATTTVVSTTTPAETTTATSRPSQTPANTTSAAAEPSLATVVFEFNSSLPSSQASHPCALLLSWMAFWTTLFLSADH